MPEGVGYGKNKKKKTNAEKTMGAMSNIPAPIPGSSAGIFAVVMRKLAEMGKKKKGKK